MSRRFSVLKMVKNRIQEAERAVKDQIYHRATVVHLEHTAFQHTVLNQRGGWYCLKAVRNVQYSDFWNGTEPEIESKFTPKVYPSLTTTALRHTSLYRKLSDMLVSAAGRGSRQRCWTQLPLALPVTALVRAAGHSSCFLMCAPLITAPISNPGHSSSQRCWSPYRILPHGSAAVYTCADDHMKLKQFLCPATPQGSVLDPPRAAAWTTQKEET